MTTTTTQATPITTCSFATTTTLADTTTATFVNTVAPTIESTKFEITEESTEKNTEIEQFTVTVLPTSPSDITTTPPPITSQPFSTTEFQSGILDRVETEVIPGINNVTMEEVMLKCFVLLICMKVHAAIHLNFLMHTLYQYVKIVALPKSIVIGLTKISPIINSQQRCGLHFYCNYGNLSISHRTISIYFNNCSLFCVCDICSFLIQPTEQTTTLMKELTTTIQTTSTIMNTTATSAITTVIPVFVTNITTETSTVNISSTKELYTTTPIPSTTTSTTTTTTTAIPITTTTAATATTEKIEYGVANFPPRRDKRLKKIPVTAGKPLSYIIPANTFTDLEDGNTRNLKLNLYLQRVPLKTTHWLQFNKNTQEVYGL